MFSFESPPEAGTSVPSDRPGPRHRRAWQIAIALLVVAALAWLGFSRWSEEPTAASGNAEDPGARSTEAGPGPEYVRSLGTVRTLEPEPGDTGRLLVDIHEVTDVHATVDGWAVLDGRGARVVLLDSIGRVTGSLGAAGPGPGELVSPTFVARNGPAVAVLDLTGTRLDVFGSGGAHLFRARPRAEGCPGARAGGLEAFADEWLVMLRCTRREGVSVHVVGVSDDGVVRTVGTDPGSPGHDPFYKPLLLAASGVYLGSTLSNCLEKLQGPGPSRRCLRQLPELPLPARARESMERRLGPRARAVGLDMRIPERLPQLMDIAPLAAGDVAVRRPADEETAPWVVESETEQPQVLRTNGTDRLEPGPLGVLVLVEELAGTRSWVARLNEARR